jgi:hypothetical protein
MLMLHQRRWAIDPEVSSSTVVDKAAALMTLNLRLPVVVVVVAEPPFSILLDEIIGDKTSLDFWAPATILLRSRYKSTVPKTLPAVSTTLQR